MSFFGLRTTDIQDETRRVFLRVRGKGDKERMVPMLPALGRRVRRYAQKGRPLDTSSDRIFLSLRRRPGGDYEPLTRSGVDQMLRALAERVQLTKRVHANVFRHSFPTYSLTRGMNPVQLAPIMGHSSLAMIQSVYSHLSSQDAYEALLKALGSELRARRAHGRLHDPDRPLSYAGRSRTPTWSRCCTKSAMRRTSGSPSARTPSGTRPPRSRCSGG